MPILPICIQVVDEIVSNIGVIEKLTFFEHKDANGKDWGLNVRQRAKELVALVNDPERIRSERHKVPKPTITHAPLVCVSQDTVLARALDATLKYYNL